jgi:hypothetical protein
MIGRVVAVVVIAGAIVAVVIAEGAAAIAEDVVTVAKF